MSVTCEEAWLVSGPDRARCHVEVGPATALDRHQICEEPVFISGFGDDVELIPADA
jgi:hypothetical protein